MRTLVFLLGIGLLARSAWAQDDLSLIADPAERPRPTENDKPLIDDAELHHLKLVTEPESKEAPQDSPIPANLAQAINRALRANPEVVLAVARVDEARAQCDQIRLKVVEQVSQAIHQIEANRDEQLSLRRRRTDRNAPEQGKSEGTLQAELAGIWAHLGYLAGAGHEDPQGKSTGAKTYAETLAADLAGDMAKAMARALRSNPDLRLAEAQVREALAELNHTKLATARRVTIAFHRLRNARQVLSVYEAGYESGTSPLEKLIEPRQVAAESEAELLYLVGEGGDSNAADRSAETSRAPASTPQPQPRLADAERPPLPAKLRDSLSKKIRVTFDQKTLGAALQEISSKCEVRIVATTLVSGLSVQLETGREESLLNLLEMLADQTGCGFIARDYGLLAIQRADAWQYAGAAIPSDLPTTPRGTAQDH